jgi:uncharacterized protein (DUF433 family)
MSMTPPGVRTTLQFPEDPLARTQSSIDIRVCSIVMMGIWYTISGVSSGACSMTTVLIDYIVLDNKGIARIAGSRSKVTQIVCDIRNGLSPEQIHESYPHLSLAQIHAALSYYYGHKSELDARIQADEEYVEKMRGSNPGISRAELVQKYREKFGHEPGEP